MERPLIVEALRATNEPETQKEASAFLTEKTRMIGFSLLLLDIVNDDAVDFAIRQSAVIYLKNMLKEQWCLEAEDVGKLVSISEQDKDTFRQIIIPATVKAPPQLKIHLCIAIQFILRHDFPEVWPGVIDEILRLFNQPNGDSWYTGLLITHRLTKIYEYKRQADKGPFLSAMSHILPVIHDRFAKIIEDPSKEANLLQKLMLKIFYCFIQFSLNTEHLSAEAFGSWLHLFVVIVEREVPQECNAVDVEEREETVWWKCKKWALKIIERVFERYGSKGHVDQHYQAFAEFYTNNYMSPVVSSVMKVLERYVNREYVTDRVIYLSLGHVAEALSHGQIWKMIKPHVENIFNRILFPLMMYTEADEELWEDEPEAYIREKQDCFEETRDPACAAIRFIRNASRRKGILQPILAQVIDKLEPAKQSGPQEIDGALHVIAALAGSLAEDRRYKKDVEKLLAVHVKPRLAHFSGFVRARALYVIREAAVAPLSNRIFLAELVDGITAILKDPKEALPVKFEAAMAIQSLIENLEDSIAPFIKPRIGDLINEVLRMLAQHNLEDLPPVIETLIEKYHDDVIPVAEGVVFELINVFHQMTRQEDGGTIDDVSITIMGILATLETVLALVEEHGDILAKIEPMVSGLCVEILDAFASDYFEECSSLIDRLLTHHVSPSMWIVYDKLLAAYEVEGGLYFSDAMPALTKFVTTDTVAFLSDPNRMKHLLMMCETVINDTTSGDDIATYGLKMIEILLTHCHGHMDEYYDHVVTLLWGKGNQFENFDDVSAQRSISLLAALLYNYPRFVQLNGQIHGSDKTDWLYTYLLTHSHKLHGIHDRTVLLYAILFAYKLPVEQRPAILQSHPMRIMGIMIEIFRDIQRCRHLIAQQSEDDSEDEEDEDLNDDRDADLHDSDDDVDNQETVDYINSLNRDTDSEDSESHHAFVEVTELEEFETPFDGENPRINIHIIFMQFLEDLRQSDQTLYKGLVLDLDEEKQTSLHQLMELCQQEHQHARSKELNSSGGYSFDATAGVPNQFNFN